MLYTARKQSGRKKLHDFRFAVTALYILWESILGLTDVDSPVFGAVGDAANDQASPFDRQLVEVFDELVALAVNAGRPQRARAQTLAIPHLRGKKRRKIFGGKILRV